MRIRRGQAAFRKTLLSRYGATCAFSGPCPAEALDAAHLYSYSKTGEHSVQGGLFIRLDLHRLFDLGLLVVQPVTHRLDVQASLLNYPEYAKVAGQLPSIRLSGGQLRWLLLHWKQHRAGV